MNNYINLLNLPKIQVGKKNHKCFTKSIRRKKYFWFNHVAHG